MQAKSVHMQILLPDLTYYNINIDKIPTYISLTQSHFNLANMSP